MVVSILAPLCFLSLRVVISQRHRTCVVNTQKDMARRKLGLHHLKSRRALRVIVRELMTSMAAQPAK